MDNLPSPETSSNKDSNSNLESSLQPSVVKYVPATLPEKKRDLETKLNSSVGNRNGKKSVDTKILFVVLVLVLLIVIFGYLLKLLGGSLFQNGEGESVLLTPVVTITTQPPDLVSVDLKSDIDKDGIPDTIEKLTGYDPGANDCVRNAGCGEVSSLPRAKLRLNVVFIMDVSGSMNSEVSGLNKWESSKTAMENLFSRKLPKYLDVGVVMYGHVGSASEADRDLSCKSVDIIRELSPLPQEGLTGLFNDKRPLGWTPLASSLTKAGEMLSEREGEANYIVVLSDGQETCGGDPVTVAGELRRSGIEVTTNVVGLSLTDEERRQLEAIAKSGGGGFFPAEEPQGLERALTLSTEILLRWEELNKCIAENVAVYSQCIGTQYLQSVNEIKRMRLEYLDQHVTAIGDPGVVDERDYIESENKVWQTYEFLRNDNWGKYKDDLELLSPQ